MSIQTTSAAYCLRCDWEDDSPAADSKAEKHSKKSGHPTVTTTKPVVTP